LTNSYILGLDLGTNSIGWSAVTVDSKGNPNGILDMGVRIFSDGRDPQSKASRAVDRRIARGARRRRDRYLRRRANLLENLVILNLMPEDENASADVEQMDPYEIRARALDSPVSAFELGRALFHLNQRRGFKSNRKSDAGQSDAESGVTWESITELRARISESGSRTLGEYLSRRKRKGQTVRAHAYTQGLYPDRSLYENEFDAIRNSQEPHHTLNETQWDHLRQIIFHQRPLKPVEPGWCLFEEGEYRAPKALPIAQDYRIVQEVNNIKVRQPGDHSERFLTPEERGLCIKHLRTKTALKFDQLVKLLKLDPDTDVNLGRGGRDALKGDETSARMRRRATKKRAAIFGSAWDDIPTDKRTEIVRTLIDEEDLESVISTAQKEWSLNEESAVLVASMQLPAGHMNLSETAINKLLPHMETEGMLFHEAVGEVTEYSHHSDFRPDTAYDQLPYYGQVLSQHVSGGNPQSEEEDEVTRFGRITNPTVHIGLNQIRRVINKLISIHGKPEKITVELARELKLPPARVNEMNKRNRDNEAANEERTRSLEEAGIHVTGDGIRRLKLWEEQGPPGARICPYTGEIISFQKAVSAETEIDHILPRSRTLDDSYANQILCIAGANRQKGNRSPFEAFGTDKSRYSAMTTYAQNLPANKKWRFMPDAMDRFDDQGQFLDRQLNETMYLSRIARTYLAHLYNEKEEGRLRVHATPGRLTAKLRKGWGLDSVLDEIAGVPKADQGNGGKSRDDHRHHAIDAFVVAVTSPGILQLMSKAAEQIPNQDYGPLSKIAAMLPPWKEFTRETLKPYVEGIVVSHRPDHGTRLVEGKTSGQLHNETAYGLVEDLGDGNWLVAVRKALSNFARRAQLEAVRDPALKQALLNLWDATVAKGLKPADFAEQAANGVNVGGKSTKVRSVRVTEKQRVIEIRDPDGKSYKGYKPDSNEYGELWRLPDGKCQLSVVRRFDANSNSTDSSINRPHPAAKKMMRLQINDCVKSDENPKTLLRICQIKSAGVVVMAPLHEANVDARSRKGDIKYTNKNGSQLGREGFRKVGIDELGRVLDPHQTR